MTAQVNRRTVDLSGYPERVVSYLCMRVNALSGLKTLLGFGPKISASVDARPGGPLLHEYFVFSLVPPRIGFRQWWLTKTSFILEVRQYRRRRRSFDVWHR